jgi:hypothetical protein
MFKPAVQEVCQRDRSEYDSKDKDDQHDDRCFEILPFFSSPPPKTGRQVHRYLISTPIPQYIRQWKKTPVLAAKLMEVRSRDPVGVISENS